MWVSFAVEKGHVSAYFSNISEYVHKQIAAVVVLVKQQWKQILIGLLVFMCVYVHQYRVNYLCKNSQDIFP